MLYDAIGRYLRSVILLSLFIACADKSQIGEYICMAQNGCQKIESRRSNVEIAGNT
jgi:hypothetical protein